MDLNLWTWAWTSVLDVVIWLFNTAVTTLGVATLTIIALIFLSAVVRLIVQPLLGMATHDMLDTALHSTSREIRSAKVRDERIKFDRRRRKWDRAYAQRLASIRNSQNKK